MCAIIGYVGSKDAQDIILKGLDSLEYRGYDSAGISVVDEKIHTTKKAGRLSTLKEILDNNPLKGHIGIGHTRWATHGIPSDINAHPHMDTKKEFSIVHNGIIENYMELKNELEGTFLSDTDSEVIAHLIATEYDGDLLRTSEKITKKLRGAYALGIISSKEPETLIGIRRKNPLILGISDEGYFISSDVSALIPYTKKVIYLEEGDIVKLTPHNYEIYNNEKKVEREVSTVEWDIETSTKGGYEHFMMKEIHEQPQALIDTLTHRIKDEMINLEEAFKIEELKNIKTIKMIGCGTAYHAGLLGQIVMENLTEIPTTVEIASEFNYSNPKIDKDTLVLLVSQSGETSDTLTALALAKEKGVSSLAITNVVGSSIAREADKVLYTWAGPEISVASTKAYTTQLALLYLLAIDFAKKLNKINSDKEKALCTKLLEIPEKIEKWLKKEYDWKNLASIINKKSSCFYLGRQGDFYSAKEGALKLKELSYIHAEALPAGELKHGPLSLIEEDVPVIIIATKDELHEKTLSNIKEVKARGASTIVITTDDTNLFDEISEVIKIPKIENIFTPIMVALPLQLLAYHTAYIKGNDVDKPRNLAKSVTVE